MKNLNITPRLFSVLILLLLGSLPLLQGCGGSSSSTADIPAALTLELPSALSALKDYRVTLSLYDSEDANLLWGPETLTQNTTDAAGTLWNASGTGLGAWAGRDCTIHIDLEVLPIGFPAAAGNVTESIDVTVGQIRQGLHLSAQSSSLTLTYHPGDFSTDLDDDGDSISNYAEVAGELNPFSIDSDGDGVEDGNDTFALDATEFSDADQDGIGDNGDNCSQVVNIDQADLNQDGEGDVCDEDDDGDGISDTAETASGSDPRKTDSDGDGVGDFSDNCRLDKNSDQTDTDGDDAGDRCDTDDDNDSIVDLSDNCPLVANPSQSDTDQNDLGDACTDDDDGDDIVDFLDNCPSDPNPIQTDTDIDTLGDTCDDDDDNDTLLDTDELGLGLDHAVTNPLSTDTDADGIPDSQDNCPIVANANQTDTDNDSEGDACDCAPQDPTIRIRNGIFVAVGGNDANSGAINQPVATIGRGIELAQENESAVYVTEGVYSESVTLTAGVSLYGGFSPGGTCLRDLATHVSVLTSNNNITLTVGVGSFPSVISGMTLKNTGTTSPVTLVVSGTDPESDTLTLEKNTIFGANNATQSSLAVLVQNASPTLVNNLIDGGDSYTSTALQLIDSASPAVAHNTIYGGLSTSSTAVTVDNSSPRILNNILLTDGTGSGLEQQTVVSILGNSLPPGMSLQGNLLAGSTANNPAKLLAYTSGGLPYTDITIMNSLDGAGGNVDGNITTLQSFTNLFTDIVQDDFHLLPLNPAIDVGLDVFSLIGLNVSQDRESNSRTNNDLGAYEY